MRIENYYATSLEAQETLNTSLNSAKSGQFSLMLSLMMAPVYSPDLHHIYSHLSYPEVGSSAIFPTHIPSVYDPPGLTSYVRPPAYNLHLVEDTYSRTLAKNIQIDMGEALVQGNAGYYSWLRALTEEFPRLQFVTTLKPAEIPPPTRALAAYAANAKPDTNTLIEEINRVKTAS